MNIDVLKEPIKYIVIKRDKDGIPITIKTQENLTELAIPLECGNGIYRQIGLEDDINIMSLHKIEGYTGGFSEDANPCKKIIPKQVYDCSKCPLLAFHEWWDDNDAYCIIDDNYNETIWKDGEIKYIYAKESDCNLVELKTKVDENMIIFKQKLIKRRKLKKYED